MHLADDPRPSEHPPAPSLRLPQDVSREGTLLRLKTGAILPPRCIYCNAPVETPAREIPVSSPNTPTLSIKGHLCEIHRIVRAQVIVSVIGTLLMTISAAGFAWLRGAEMLIVLAIIVAGLLGAWLRAIVIRKRTPPLRVDHIEAEFLYITGAGPDFLDTLPKAPS